MAARRKTHQDMSSLDPVRKIIVVDATIDGLRKFIAERGLRPGDRLPPERDLATALSVSRNSLREALKSLSVQGVLDIRHGSGIYVREQSLEPFVASMVGLLSAERALFVELIEARQTVDAVLVGLAAERATPDDLVAIAAFLEREGNPSEAQMRVFEVEFEKLLGRAAHNRILLPVQQLVHELWIQRLQELGHIPRPRHASHADHVEIFEYVKRRDRAGAQARMLKHLEAGLAEAIESNRRAESAEKPPET